MSREKQIEEMAKVYYEAMLRAHPIDVANGKASTYYATAFYNAGYCRQSEGEWIDSLKGYCQCSNCRTSFETLPTTFLFKLNNRFCRHCGAKMKGGAE